MATKLEGELRNLGTGAGWTYPYFLPALSQTTFIEDPAVPTLQIDAKGNLRFNGKYLEDLTPQQRIFALFHELMHPLSQHHDRRQERQPGAWNIAGDMVINHFLKGIGLHPPDGLFYPEAGWEDLCAEEMYERVRMDDKWSKRAAGLNPLAPFGSGQVGKGCSCPASDPADPAGNVAWDKVAAQAKAAAAGEGPGIGDAFGRVLTPRPSGQRWNLFIRGVCSRAKAEHGRDEQTWATRSRRSPPGVLLPGYRSTKARVAVLIDLSGSMTDDQRGRCLDETQAVARTGDAKVFLVCHTSAVTFAGWLDGTKRTLLEQHTGATGGTAFAPGYSRIENERAKFDAMVHLTDGMNFGEWPQKPVNVRKLIAALTIPVTTPGIVERPQGTVDVEIRI